LNIDEVRTLRLAAELGSFSKAAEYLNVSQPAVSQRIRHLETELGVELFARHGRRVRLSTAGTVLLDFARDLDVLLAELRQKLASVIPESHSVVVGASPGTAGWILPALYAAYYEREPLGHVRTVVLPPSQVRAGVQHGDLDFAVMAQFHATEDLKYEPLLDAQLHLTASPEHPLANLGRPPLPEELSGQAFVTGTIGTLTRKCMVDWCKAHGVAARVVMEVDSHDALATAVKQGIGIGFILETSIATDVKAGDLVILDVPDAPLEFPLVLAYSPSYPRSAPADALIAALKAGTWRMQVPHLVEPILA